MSPGLRRRTGGRAATVGTPLVGVNLIVSAPAVTAIADASTNASVRMTYLSSGRRLRRSGVDGRSAGPLLAAGCRRGGRVVSGRAGEPILTAAVRRARTALAEAGPLTVPRLAAAVPATA